MTTETFKPSNGTHGELFCAAFCWRCKAEEGGKECPLLTATLVYDEADPEYPKEWVIDTDAHPGLIGGAGARCTAFQPIT